MALSNRSKSGQGRDAASPGGGAAAVPAPRFYLTGRQRLSVRAVVLAIVAAVGALSLVLYGLIHNGRSRLGLGGSGADRSASAASSGSSADDDKDDPNQVDTILLGDPSDAPVPGRRGDHVSPVHPTILVRLPRFGDQVGLIPNSPAGRLLYDWLAAFNKQSAAGLESVLPDVGPAVMAAQMELRQQTGGFALVSAKEVQPGVLVFRLRDQTAASGEVLGTLQVRAGSRPAVVGSFSLRAVAVVRQESGAVVRR